MRYIKEHRTANCIKGFWGEPDPLNGPEWVTVQEMHRRTIERQLGKSFPPGEIGRVRRYTFIPDDPNAPIADGVPGVVSIHLDDTGL